MKAPDRTGSLDLLILARDPQTPPAGIRACPPHLLEDLPALPGETLQQLVRRALSTAVGQGAGFALVYYADEVMH